MTCSSTTSACPLFRLRIKGGCLPARTCRQAGFYLAAVNGMIRTPVEGPSIGVTRCESPSGPIVEFALENINQPIGVSTYHVTRASGGAAHRRGPVGGRQQGPIGNGDLARSILRLCLVHASLM